MPEDELGIKAMDISLNFFIFYGLRGLLKFIVYNEGYLLSFQNQTF